MLVACLKKCLDAKKGRSFDLLKEVLWAYNIMKKSSTSEISFRVAYGTEAMAPTEVKVPS